MAGLPVGVLGNQGACVIARNYPMKKFGVKVGEPIWESKKKCPDGVFIKRDFRWYESLSRKMFAEVGTFSPRVEYYSIDEFFWEGYPARGQNYQQTATTIRDHVKKNAGLPMTVAFARTRTLAKLFADTAKPFGAVAVTDRGSGDGTPRDPARHGNRGHRQSPCRPARTLRNQDMSRSAERQWPPRQECADDRGTRPLAGVERLQSNSHPPATPAAPDDRPRRESRRTGE